MRARLKTIAICLGVTAVASAAPRNPSLVLTGTPAAPPMQVQPMQPASAPTSRATSDRSPALAIAALDRKIADIDAEEASDKHELDALGGKLADAHAHAITRGRAYYKLTRAGMLPIGGGFDALVTHAMHVERARRSLANDLTAESQLRQRGADLSRALERIARERVSLATERTTLDAARIAAADDARRQSAFDRAFTSSSGTGDYVAVYGGNGASSDLGGASFQASRGRLLFPVTGRAEVHPAQREGANGPGLEIFAPIGSPVRAVFAGRVVFADRYGPYGRLVIVDHGEHYYTVSGNLAAIDVKVGADVVAGETLGTVGDDGHGAMLYFEVRKGTETTPPGPWLGL